MNPLKKPYKKASKANRKKKEIPQNENGELSKVNSGKRFPIVSLPEIITSPIYQVYRRYIAQGAVSGNISITDLFNQFMVAVTSVLAETYVFAVRLKKIRVLAPVTTQGSSVLVSMKPNAPDTALNSYTGVPEKYIDTSASIDIPAYLSLTPTLATPFGSWHKDNNVSINLLEIVCPSGSTLDILYEFILRDTTATAPQFTRVVAAATTGVMFGAPILTNLIPQGINSI